MGNDIFKDFSELPKNIDFKSKDTQWCWGIGGHGLRDNQYTIQYVREDYGADIYVLPDFLNQMFSIVKKWGRDEKMEEIKSALELN